jgi:hypothetical protein
MRDRRGTLDLLPEKIIAIRVLLTFSEAEMASAVRSDILSYRDGDYDLKPGKISAYENGRLEPNLLVLVAYARLGEVHLELLADDRFTINEFREELGKRK